MEKGDVQTAQFPWFHIIQWCADERGAHIVWRYDINKVKSKVLRLSQNEETFYRECNEIDEYMHFSLDEDNFFLEWAADLLDQIETLKLLRYQLVPAKIKEDVFWRRYFSAVKRVITNDFFVDPNAKELAPGSPIQQTSPHRQRPAATTFGNEDIRPEV